MTRDHQPAFSIAQNQVAGLPHNAVAQLLEHTNRILLADAGQARYSDRQLKRLHLLDTGLFCLHLKPKANGLTDAGKSFFPGLALGVAARQIQATHRPTLVCLQ
jgi:hypothetical protein